MFRIKREISDFGDFRYQKNSAKKLLLNREMKIK